MVNESAVRAFGWTDPLAQKVYVPGDSTDQELAVIGVVKDFHYASLHTPIEPIAIFQGNPRYGVNNLLLRLAPGDVQDQLKALEGRFKAIPERADLPADINESLVVELYSK